MKLGLTVLRPSDTGVGRFGWRIFVCGHRGIRCIIRQSSEINHFYNSGSEASAAGQSALSALVLTATDSQPLGAPSDSPDAVSDRCP